MCHYYSAMCTLGISLVQMVKKVNVVVKEMLHWLHCYDLVYSPMVKARPVRTCIHTKKTASGSEKATTFLIWMIPLFSDHHHSPVLLHCCKHSGILSTGFCKLVVSCKMQMQSSLASYNNNTIGLNNANLICGFSILHLLTDNQLAKHCI